MERLCLSAGPRERLGVPPEELEEVAGDRDVWVSLLKLLPPRTPGETVDDGWMDFFNIVLTK